MDGGGGRCVEWRWPCLEKVSEDLNDISGDSIRLPNSFHPSDERTSPGFQWDGAGAFLRQQMGSGHTDKQRLLFL